MRPLSAALVVLPFTFFLFPSSFSLERFESVEAHMGTLVRVTVYTRDEQSAKEAFRTAFGRIAALDRTLSDYRADSEQNEIARTAVGRSVPVSDDLFAVLAA